MAFTLLLFIPSFGREGALIIDHDGLIIGTIHNSQSNKRHLQLFNACDAGEKVVEGCSVLPGPPFQAILTSRSIGSNSRMLG